ncbi:MAG: hypothetical protein J1E98_06035 [Lachnospiraceae bacterium]|nr:hypothetical protein [Lachnospiraceae bacterium]
MAFVETYYLIDYENVNEDGLTGSEKLGSHDHVLIFSTKNASKISIGKLNDFNSVDLSSHEIPAGNQSLDMHLVSYLGYLIGTNNNNKCEYIIISKDTDYDNIISFWKTHNILNIKRKDSINAEENIADNNKNTSETVIASDKTDTSAKNNKVKIDPEMKTQLNNKVQQAIRKAGYTQSVTNKVTSIVLTHYGNDTFASNVHNELRENYTDYLDLYKIVKPIISKYSITNTDTNKTNTNSQLNSEIQKILSTAGFKNDIISYVASLVTKHHNDNNAKQVIYTDIVSKYGQAKGLNIYNHIKKNI